MIAKSDQLEESTWHKWVRVVCPTARGVHVTLYTEMDVNPYICVFVGIGAWMSFLLWHNGFSFFFFLGHNASFGLDLGVQPLSWEPIPESICYYGPTFVYQRIYIAPLCTMRSLRRCIRPKQTTRVDTERILWLWIRPASAIRDNKTSIARISGLSSDLKERKDWIPRYVLFGCFCLNLYFISKENCGTKNSELHKRKTPNNYLMDYNHSPLLLMIDSTI